MTPAEIQADPVLRNYANCPDEVYKLVSPMARIIVDIVREMASVKARDP